MTTDSCCCLADGHGVSSSSGVIFSQFNAIHKLSL